jgi:large subunit ribosomal protein L22
MEVRAVNKFTGISAQKTRLVLNEMRGRPAQDALAILQFMPQRAAQDVENFGLDAEDLYISKIVADEAPTRKWRRFGARGRFKPWLRRSAHITVVLDEREID